MSQPNEFLLYIFADSYLSETFPFLLKEARVFGEHNHALKVLSFCFYYS